MLKRGEEDIWYPRVGSELFPASDR